MNDIPVIKDRLASSAESFCRHFFPDGKLVGKEYCLGSLNGEPGNSLKICIQGDRTGVWKDFATGESGNNLLKLLTEKVKDFPTAVQEAKRWLNLPEIHRKSTIVSQPDNCCGYDRQTLVDGTADDYDKLSKLLNISIDGLKLANADGILKFFNHYTNGRCWSVISKDDTVRQDRRLDGNPFVLKNGSTTKCRTIGSPSHIVGVPGDNVFIMLVEGSSDLLAAYSIICLEKLQELVRPVAILGAANMIKEDDLRQFKGKYILGFPDYDQAGVKGMKKWEDQLKGSVSEFSVYDYNGMTMPNGQPVNDLRDFVQIDRTNSSRDVELPISQFIDNLTGSSTAQPTDSKHIKSSMIYHSLASLLEDSQKYEMPEMVEIVEVNETTLEEAMFSASDLNSRELKKRKPILGDWFLEGNLGYVFGFRGLGKTWFTWKMAIDISKGRSFGPWQPSEPKNVLYVDGEMNADSMKQRLNLIDPSNDNKNLIFLSQELMFCNNKSISLNLCKPDQQDALLNICMRRKIKVLFLDNISCLFSGLRENDANDWEKVRNWLLLLRNNGVSVVIIHHSNRGKDDMRGTSRREDAADWIIKIKDSESEDYEYDENVDFNTRFTTSFTKNRIGSRGCKQPINWSFVTSNNKMTVSWEYAKISREEKILEMIMNGIRSNKDIVRHSDLSKGYVSNVIKKLILEGKIQKIGRFYSSR